MCDAIPINLNENKTNCKTQNLYIFLVFLLITIALLIAVNIYCYLIKQRGKQEHLLPFHFTNNKLKEIIYTKNINKNWVINSKIWI